MKKILLILAVTFAFSGCEKKEEVKKAEPNGTMIFYNLLRVVLLDSSLKMLSRERMILDLRVTAVLHGLQVVRRLLLSADNVNFIRIIKILIIYFS